MISKLSNLRILSLRDTDADDSDLSKLSALTHLEQFNLRMCNHLTKSSINSLCKMKSLKSVYLPEELITTTNEETLQKAIPGLKYN